MSTHIILDNYCKNMGSIIHKLTIKADLAFRTVAEIKAGSTSNTTIETFSFKADVVGVSIDYLIN